MKTLLGFALGFSIMPLLVGTFALCIWMQIKLELAKPDIALGIFTFIFLLITAVCLYAKFRT